MDFVTGMIASAIIGGAASLFGGKQQNSANAAQAAQANAFSAEQAEIARNWDAEQAATARQFAERMSNTSYQRGMADMRSAGLNPILAYQQGGASTPQIGAPTSPSPSGTQAHMENVLGPAASSALQAARTVQEFRSIDAQIANTDANTKKAFADASTSIAAARNYDAQTAKTIIEGKNAGLTPQSIEASIGQMRASAADLTHSARAREMENEWGRDYGPRTPGRDTAINAARIQGQLRNPTAPDARAARGDLDSLGRGLGDAITRGGANFLRSNPATAPTAAVADYFRNGGRWIFPRGAVPPSLR